VAPPARHSGAAETGAPLPPLASEATFPDDTSSAAGASNESRRVAEARVLLRAGRSRESLAVLERIGREIPNGALAQEREALAIEALLALGQREVARSRAVTFLARHPRSPHAAAARRALE
jgi:outer membrane protein assembly factor BamD (BamD/ComL family)